jgi:hypothetical protein
MKTLIIIVALTFVIMTAFAETKVLERTKVFTEDDSLVIHYNTGDPDLTVLFVTKSNLNVGKNARPNENPPVYKLVEIVGQPLFYLDKTWTVVFVNNDGVWSKVKMPPVGIHDFTWKFQIKYEKNGGVVQEEAYSVVDQYSDHAVQSSSRDKTPHFLLEITPMGFPLAKGNMRK